MHSAPPLPRPNLTHHHLASCTSTNSVLMEWLNSKRINNDSPYMLTASTQTAGRGQYERSWQSPIGNLYLSLYHPINVPLSGLLSLVVGYQLTRLPIIQNLNQVFRQTNKPNIGVKWANDIGFYSTTNESSSISNQDFDNRPLTFNKLAGILIEPVIANNLICGVIIGVGINIDSAPILNQKTREGMDYDAISINQLLESNKYLYSNNHQQKHQSPPILRAEDLYVAVGSSIVRAVEQFSNFKETSYSLNKFLSDYNTTSVLVGRKVLVYPPKAGNNNNQAEGKENNSEYAQNNSIDNLSMNNSNTSNLNNSNSNNSNSNISNLNIKRNSSNQVLAEKPSVIKGKVLGINADGSLKLEQENVDKTLEVIKVYTGTIRALQDY